MNKKQLTSALLQYNKGKYFISVSAFRLWLGIGQNKAVDMLKGLECLEADGRKTFFIPDVAERILERSHTF